MTETDLLCALRQRADGSLELFLRKYGPLIRYVLRPLLADAQELEECVSDVAMRVWEKIDTFDPSKGSFTTWLTVLTRNTGINKTRRKQPPLQELTPDLPDSNADPEKILLIRERQQHLTNVLNTLSTRDKTLLFRKYYYLQSTEQIARELGLTVRSVEGKLYRLKKKLRTKLGGDFFE